MSNILNSSNRKGEEQNNEYLEVKINPQDQLFQKNSVLLKDMIFVQKNDKISQIINPNNRNNVIMQKWAIQESQRNQQNQNIKLKQLEQNNEFASPQKERRFSQTSITKIKDSKGVSPKKNQEGSQNLLDSDIKKHQLQSSIQDQNKGNSQRSDVKQNTQPQDTIKTIELQLDTNDRYRENLNRTNFFTERTSSLIEMNKRKKSKQKSQQKSPQNVNQNILPENEQNKSSTTIQQEGASIKKLDDGVNSNFFRTHFSNLLTNQKSNGNITGQDNQFVNSKNSRQLLKTLIVFDNGTKKRDDIRGSILNKSDNEIRLGKWDEQEKKDQQNMTQSEIYNISGEKYVQPKRKLLEFPQQDQQQTQNLFQIKINSKKPFMSGAQSHNNGGYNGLPSIKTNYKKSSQSPSRYMKSDLLITEVANNKTQQTLVSDHMNKTIYSPINPYQNGNDSIPIMEGIKNKQNSSNNNISQTLISDLNQNSQTADMMNKFCDVPNGNANQSKNTTQIEFFQVNSLSPLILNKQKAKSNSVNQQRNSDFIELNKKNLKFINKKKTPYNQIVDSILKQHDIKEKDDKKIVQKEKRKKFQQTFKQKTNSQMQNEDQQFQFQIHNKNLTTTLGSEFGNHFQSNNPSPDGKGNNSFTNRNSSTQDSNFFQPQGLAMKNKLIKEKQQSPYQQYLEKQIELETKRQTSQRFQKQNPQTSINFYPQSESLLQEIQNGGGGQQFAISYQQQQQIQFKRKMRNISSHKQRQLTVEDQMNSEQIKQKIINVQQQKATIQSSNYSPSNQIANNLINDSKILNNSYLNTNNITNEQLVMTQNLQKQASQIKKQQQLQGINGDSSQFLQNALNNAGQSMLYIKKWKGELPRQNHNGDLTEWNDYKKSTTAAGPRQKIHKQTSSDVMLIDEDQFSVNYRPKYNYDRIEQNNQQNHYSSKKRIKSQNGPRVNASHDLAQYIKSRKEISPRFKNEIQPWDTSEQMQYYEEDDMCINSKV